jgi:hypothetical protein
MHIDIRVPVVCKTFSWMYTVNINTIAIASIATRVILLVTTITI